ncbi:hypothetical protein JB92DRAFT_204084 [Gautieria morchelliformis]|nr:hypothetical protein JB92DRAFT_204084 [Gautieria morchelliformis]
MILLICGRPCTRPYIPIPLFACDHIRAAAADFERPPDVVCIFKWTPPIVIRHSIKIRTVKCTANGKITIECHRFPEPPGLRVPQQIAVEASVADTACGLSEKQFRKHVRLRTS